MQITISGNLGSGKSTIAKLLAKKYDLKHYSVGDFMRQLAKNREISLLELSKIAEEDKSVDEELDNMTKNLRKQDDFVIDSRLAFHFLPESLKIFLKVTYDVAAQRIFKDNRDREKENISLEQTKQNIITRTESEKKRYQEYYGLDYTNEQNYDLVIDTSDKDTGEIINIIVEYIENKNV